MQNLAEFLNRCGTVAEAARQLEVSQQTIHRWRKGGKPSRLTVIALQEKGLDLTNLREPKPATL